MSLAAVPKSGQTKCYDSAGLIIGCAGTGQNGELTAGSPWPSSRFTVNADQSVSDNLTSLTWVKDGNLPGPAACSPGIAKNLLDAQNYINCLNTNYYLGRTDWRIPSINELRSLISHGQAKQSTWLNASGFTGIKDVDYWSSTTSAQSPSSAWTLTMGTGGVTTTTAKSSPGYVLAVRSGSGFVSDAVYLQPLSHSFGSVASGAVSFAKEFKITNGGSSTLTVSGITIGGSDPTHFTVAPGGSAPCASLTPSIAGNGSCTVNVTFAPTESGPKDATLNISSNSSSRPTITVPVTGIASAAGIAVSPKSGQTKCYDSAGLIISCSGTGQNGEKTAGSPWPSTRFTVNADGSVSDNLTSLTWIKDGNLPGPAACSPGIAKNLLDAQNYINCLNTNYYLGRTDWRIPSINELRSLINYGQVKQSTWLNASGFTGIKDLDYWSSTTSVQSPSSAWTVTMGTGGVTTTAAKSTTGYVLAVRSGSGVVADAVYLQPLSHNFGSVTSGAVSVAKEFKITNGGSSTLTVSAITIGGNDPTEFTVTPGGATPCASLTPSIAGNGSCTVNVTFAPTESGPKDATLNISSNSASRPTITVPVTGIASAAGIVVSPKSGQTKCYDSAGLIISCSGTGQNGDKTAGSPWPSTRFTVNADGSVSDNLTSLTWIKDGNLPGPAACSPGIAKNLLDAQNYINCLNTNYYLGRTDWRIPSINELRSLINYGQAKQSTWLNASGFTGIKDLDYWSSTTSAQSPSSAWTVTMGTGGATTTTAKSTPGYVLPVRSVSGVVADAVYLQPLSHSFGSVVGGAVSVAKEFKITNGGSSTLTVSSITMGGNDPTQFTVAPGGAMPCASLTPSIAGNGFCTVNVTFTPTESGPKDATLNISSNSSSRSNISVPVTGIAATAGIVVSPKSGQTKCYDSAGLITGCAGTGQNGELTAGSPWPSGRFTVNADQSVSDNLTSLTWIKDGNLPGPAACSPGIAKNLLDAQNYINCLNTNYYLGRTDWRIPSINELRSLINYGQAKQSTWLNASGFTGIKELDYWSSTTSAQSPSSAWTLTMGTGGVITTTAKSTPGYVLVVRSGSGVVSDAVYLQPLSHSFGSVTSGAVSVAKEFKITNGGSSTLTVSSITMGGNDPGQFTVAPGGATPCASLTPSIAGNGSCTVNVTFAPSESGPKEATLDISSNSASRPTISVPVTGIASAAGIVVTTESGQTKCYDSAGLIVGCAGTGQNGELAAGSPWPSTRFTVNADQSVSDNLTSLTWVKDGNLPGPVVCSPGVAKSLPDAQNYINCLNTNNYLGRTDWRIPSINELRSLINYGQAKQSSWLNASGFTGIKELDYWSSTTSAQSPSSAWTLTMGTGGVTTTTAKSTPGYVLPVRSGSGVVADPVYLQPLSHSFGSVTSGAVSVPKEFRITNGGSSTLTVSSITIVGNDLTQFTVTPGGATPCASLTPSIAGNGSCTVHVTFTPTSNGPKKAIVEITSNSVSRPTTTVPVTGIAAAAGIVVSPESGQTKCYDSAGLIIGCAGTGQNGELTAGSPWPSSRFTVNADQSVSDNLTSLTWIKDGNLPGPAACAPGIAKNLLDAHNYINCLNTNNYLGRTDWRIPSINELRSLINYGQAKQSTWLNASGFTGIKDLDYWSSTTSVQSPSSAWTLTMGTGGVTTTTAKSTPGYVLPVRSGSGVMADAVYVQPLSHNFGSVTSGAVSVAKEFRITNGGSSTLTLSGITIGGDDPTEFSVAPGGATPCASLAPSLAGNSSCTVNVRFAPTESGPKEATLIIFSNSGSRPIITVPVTGIATAAGIVVAPESGQIKCYDSAGSVIGCAGTGQNGELTAGETWPSTRFTVNADQSVSDTLTNLMWINDGNLPGPDACSPGVAKNLLDAQNYINCLNTNKYLGRTDWRIPSINELRSLINYGQAKQSTWLNASGFTGIHDEDYWSSTTSAQSPTSAWTLTMGTGGVTTITAKSTPGYVLAVRTGITTNGLCGSSNGRKLSSAPTLDLCSTGTPTILTGTGPWSWDCLGNQFGTTATCSANLQTWTVSVTVAGAGGGTVTSNPQGFDPSGITCLSGQCTTTFLANTSVSLLPSVNHVSTFSGWSGNCSGTTPCVLYMDGDKSVTGTFSLAPKAKIRNVPYESLAAAYRAAISGDIIMTLDSAMPDYGLNINAALTQGGSVTIRGGYTSDYSSRSNTLPTYLKGPLKISKGKLIVDGLRITP